MTYASFGFPHPIESFAAMPPQQGDFARYAHLLPQSAGPAQMSPQGILGAALGSLGAPLGGAIGGWAGNADLGRQIGGLAGTIGGALLPFSAGPGQMTPQGWGGDFLGALAPIAGQVAGGAFGNAQLGGQAGQLAGQFARMLPFSAGPGGYPGYGYA